MGYLYVLKKIMLENFIMFENKPIFIVVVLRMWEIEVAIQLNLHLLSHTLISHRSKGRSNIRRKCILSNCAVIALDNIRQIIFCYY